MPNDSKSVGLVSTSTASMSSFCTMSTCVYLSISHLLAAALFSRTVGEIERRNAGQKFGEFFDELRANATATVLTVVAALEAYANELFVEHQKYFPEVELKVMEKLWELYEMKRPLEKFEFALILRNGSELDKSASPYQDVDTLIKLRNALTHYKPEWSEEAVEHLRVSKLLKHRAVVSPFYSPNDPLFPSAWVSHGTTVWAVGSIIKFIRDFELKANLENRFARFEERLHAL